MKLTVSDIIPCVLRFLSDCGFTETLHTLKKECDIDTNAGLSQANLLKVCKFYLKHHPQAWIDEEEIEYQSESELENNKKSDIKKKSPKHKLQQINSKRKNLKDISEEELAEREEEVIITEPIKKIKTTSQAVSNKTSKNNANKKIEKAPAKEEKQEKDAHSGENNEILDNNEGEEYNGYEEDYGYNHKSKNKKSFSYVDARILGDIPEDQRDNTFEAKYKYGEGDEFGRFGNERLKEVKGRDFKKEKAKLKNKQFHGGGGRIDPFARSAVKLNFED